MGGSSKHKHTSWTRGQFSKWVISADNTLVLKSWLKTFFFKLLYVLRILQVIYTSKNFFLNRLLHYYFNYDKNAVQLLPSEDPSTVDVLFHRCLVCISVGELDGSGQEKL